MKKFKYPLVVIISLLVAIIPAFLEEQSSLLKTIISSFLVFIWLLLIFVMGVPSIKKDLSTLLSTNIVICSLFLNLLIPFLTVLALGAQIGTIFPPYLYWYIIPTCIYAFITFFQDTISDVQQFVSIILATLLYWIGFDHRYTKIIFDIFSGLSYILNGLFFVSLLMIVYGYISGIQQSNNEQDKGLTPSLEGMKIGQIASLAAAVIIVPIGLYTNFLSWNPRWPGIIDILVGFIGIFLTIALQEELVFRGILLQEADVVFSNYHIEPIYPLLITSIAFGFTHWNNEIPQFTPHYIMLATIAGIAYGWAYRKSGMFGAMIAHTLVDWIWSLALQRIPV